MKKIPGQMSISSALAKMMRKLDMKTVWLTFIRGRQAVIENEEKIGKNQNGN